MSRTTKWEKKVTGNASVLRKIEQRETLDCYYCRPNKGCNSWHKRRAKKSWKIYRKHQWKK